MSREGPCGKCSKRLVVGSAVVGTNGLDHLHLHSHAYLRESPGAGDSATQTTRTASQKGEQQASNL